MPEPTRIDSRQLQLVADIAKQKLDEAYAALDTLLDLMTPEERKSALKPPNAFVDAGKELARGVLKHPVIAAATQYDPKAVLEDLANVEILTPVAESASQVTQLVADARLAWLAEAYVPSIQVYGVAKVIAKTNADLQKIVDPLGGVFGLNRSMKKNK